MTTIYCSKKLGALIGDVDSHHLTNIPPSPLGDWNGHLFTVERRKCLAFVNNKTYYVLFFVDILKKDLETFPQLFLNRLMQQLQYDNVLKPEFESLVLEHYGKIILAGTNNDKKAIGTMNDFISRFKIHVHVKYPNLSAVNILYENNLFNDVPAGAGRQKGIRQYGLPKKDMIEIFKACAQQNAVGNNGHHASDPR